MTTDTRHARYGVVGGRNGVSKWFFLDPETEIQGFRYYLRHDYKTGERYWVADFKLRGIPTHQAVRLFEENYDGQHFTTWCVRACAQAKRLLSELPVPAPTTLVQQGEKGQTYDDNRVRADA